MQGTPSFRSSFGFLMAAIGFAVGLGNIWRFPYITGENGGGAFVMVYLLCAVGIGIPILTAEILIGRRGGGSPPEAMRKLASGDTGRNWQFAGHLNMATAFLILTTYSAVAGWVIWYLYKAATTGFAGIDAPAAALEFQSVLTGNMGMLFWTAIVLALTGSIIFSGVNNGIERSVRILMPTLFLLMVAMVIYNAFSGGFSEAVAYLFTPDFSKVSGTMILAAIGQAFFSIGVAMAGMMTFGAYLPRSVSILRCVLIIIVADTLVALMAGLMIFPIVFRFGLDPAGGTGLIFQILPVAFAQMPGGHIIAVVFFSLLSVAAITSMVGLIEPLVAWLTERYEHTRHVATLMVISSIAVVAIISILSYNLLANIQIAGLGINGLLDFLSNQIMLPVGGLLIAIFAGWVASRRDLQEELNTANAVFSVWHWLIRFVVPIAVAVILVTGLM